MSKKEKQVQQPISETDANEIGPNCSQLRWPGPVVTESACLRPTKVAFSFTLNFLFDFGKADEMGCCSGQMPGSTSLTAAYFIGYLLPTQ